MKYLGYIVGITLMVLSLVFILNEKRIATGTESLAVASNNSQVTFQMTCNGSNVFLSPTSLAATVTADLDVDGNPILTPSGGGVTVTGPLFGSSSPITIDASGVTSGGLGFVIFNSPAMRHIYSCQGVTPTNDQMQWQFDTSDNTDLTVAWAANTETDPANFTNIPGEDPTWNSFGTTQAFSGNNPTITFSQGNSHVMMQMNIAPSQTDPATEQEIEKFRALPDA